MRALRPGVALCAVTLSLGAVVSASADGGPGSLLAWGNDGASPQANLPVAVSAGAIPAGTTITQAAVGVYFSLALSPSGQLYAWGNNNSGQLGDTPSGTPVPSTVPVAVSAGAIPLGTTITQIAAGDSHSLALSSSGRLYAWGNNVNGQLGNNAAPTEGDVPVAVSGGAIPAGTTITQIAAGQEHSLALSAAGQLYAWGSNTQGQLGNNGAPTQANVPVAVSGGVIPAGTTFTQISAGARHSLALSSSGQLYAWGENTYGQLGNTPSGGPVQSNAPVAVSLPAGTTITQIAAGGFHNLALSSGGQLYAWGFNTQGELGNNGAPTQSNVPVAVSAGAIPAGTTITQIAAGAYHSLALGAAGQLYAWGMNLDGELGNNLAPTQSNVPVAVSLPSGTTIDTIARGSQSISALAVIGDLAVATGALPDGTVGVPYSTALSATGGIGPDSWTASGLPAGLAINPRTGVVGGTTSVAGPATVSVSVRDADGLTATRTLALTIATVPSVTPDSRFSTLKASVNQKTGAITLKERVSDPGTFSWVLSFRNGRYGVFAATVNTKCKPAQTRLKGKCRPATVPFGEGSRIVDAPGIVTFTVKPSRSATKALKNALIKNRGVTVTATIGYRSARGGSPTSQTRSISDKLTRVKKKR